MTDEQLTAIEQRANAATPGPWVGYPSMVYLAPSHALSVFMREGANPMQVEHDTAFIAAARSDVPALIAEVRRLRAEIDKRKQWEQMAVDHFGEIESAGMAAHSEALTLFESMKAQLYPEGEAAPAQTTVGIILQISNLVAGLRDERDQLRSDVERIGHERDQMVAANVELQERANETHAALRTMAQSWLTMAASYDASPRQQGEADTLKQCAHHLARMWDAATHPIEPVEAK